jgi:hypothetical protein
MNRNKKITAHNYRERSYALFKILCPKWHKKLESSLEFTIYGDSMRINPKAKTIRLGNYHFEFSYSSYGKSLYWIDRKSGTLLRVSDHWSSGQGVYIRCKWIASCFWRLVGKRSDPIFGKYSAGIVRFNDMENID